MRNLALCTDYDGTIAHHGQLDAPTLPALERLRASGQKLVMVTGRELDDKSCTCPGLRDPRIRFEFESAKRLQAQYVGAS
jgi:hydroxymethylpyrimidine pyrophosphatase-like HAD family hydrolase